MKITVKVPKPRNHVARVVRNPQGPFKPKTQRDRTKYTRKVKHRKVVL